MKYLKDLTLVIFISDIITSFYHNVYFKILITINLSLFMKPEDIHRLFQKYFAEQDLEGLNTLYAENAMFIPGSGKNPIFGRENIKNELKPYF